VGSGEGSADESCTGVAVPLWVLTLVSLLVVVSVLWVPTLVTLLMIVLLLSVSAQMLLLGAFLLLLTPRLVPQMTSLLLWELTLKTLLELEKVLLVLLTLETLLLLVPTLETCVPRAGLLSKDSINFFWRIVAARRPSAVSSWSKARARWCM
jgi:hypothetical protein